MTTLHKFIGLIALLTITSLCHAAPEAEYGKVSKTWTLETDGSQEFRHSLELTLFTHTAMNSTYGESFILYNPNFQEVKIHHSYTRQVDGTRIDTPDNAFVEVLPGFAADAPAYNQLKELVVVHTGLELGATIYLDYSIHTKAGYYPALDVYEFLQETSPVKEYQATLIVPEEMPLHRQLSGSAVQANESVQGGKKTIRYTLRNLPASSREAFQPQNKDERPCLAATTYESPAQALDILAKEWKKGFRMEAVGFAEYLAEKGKDDKEKADLIKKHIALNMSTAPVPLKQTGYRMRELDTTLRSAYGTIAEKTGLLQVMLDAAGIVAEVMVVYPGTLNTEVQGLAAIKEMIVKARINREDVYLSALNTTPIVPAERGDRDKTYQLSGEEWALFPAPLTIDEKKDLRVSRADAKDGYVVCSLPAIASGIDSWGMQALPSRREGTFEIPAILQEQITYTITVEEGLTLQTPLRNQVIEKPCGSFKQTITAQGDQVVVKRNIELRQSQYTPKQYTEVRELVNAWMNPSGRLLLFQE